MLAVYTQLKNAQRVKKALFQKGVLNPNYKPLVELEHIYFPILKKVRIKDAKIIDTKFHFPKYIRPVTVDSLLKNKLTPKQRTLLLRSQEIVGNILILEVPEQLIKKEGIIAKAHLDANKRVTTVVKKSKMHEGVFRTRRVKILAGKKTKETIHFESGVKIKLHMENVYFSARTGSERLRIAKQVKKGEDILVMFSGAGPLPLVLMKHSPLKSVFGIELNPVGYQYSKYNVHLNKFGDNITFINDDVRKYLPKSRKKYDRIAMPLPKSAEEFLDVALPRAKKGAIIHLYAFINESEINQEAKRISKMCKFLKKPVRVLRKVKCGQFSPGRHRVCFDLKVQ